MCRIEGLGERREFGLHRRLLLPQKLVVVQQPLQLLARRRGKVNEVLAMAILRPSGAKGILEEVKTRVGVRPSPVIVLAVDNPSLRRVEFPSTFRQAPR